MRASSTARDDVEAVCGDAMTANAPACGSTMTSPPPLARSERDARVAVVAGVGRATPPTAADTLILPCGITSHDALIALPGERQILERLRSPNKSDHDCKI